MREFKFRVWIKQWQKMQKISSIDWSLGDIYIEADLHLYSFQIDEVELMQFTGLKDKKGKEIYEGDIIKAKTVMQNMPIWIGEVMRECDYYGVDKNQDTGWVIVNKKLGSCMAFYPEQDREVIGNIYENGDLLK